MTRTAPRSQLPSRGENTFRDAVFKLSADLAAAKKPAVLTPQPLARIPTTRWNSRSKCRNGFNGCDGRYEFLDTITGED